MVKNNLFINLGGTIILNIIVGKLKTFRGTGRFTREVIKNIIIKNTNKINFNKKNVYYFYSSVDIVPTREIIKNRCLVVVHDVTPLILYKKFNLKKIKQWFFRYSYVINNSWKILTISISSYILIIKYFPKIKFKPLIIYNGVSFYCKNWIPRSKIKNIISKTYAVLLGSLDKNKNLQIILQSIPRGLDFVLIGDLMKTKLDGLRGRLFYFAKLKDFYSESIIKSSGFLLFSSLYEGYGMPPIEAIILKVNSISSNRPSMREILGGRSILLNANSITEWSLALRKNFRFKNINFKTILKIFYYYINWKFINVFLTSFLLKNNT